MATTCSIIFLSLLLSCLLLQSNLFNVVAAPFSSSSNTLPQLATVHIINGLPEDSDQLEVRCNSKTTDLGNQIVKSGEDYKWSVQERTVYYCEGMWGRFFSSWRGYQPKRDRNHATVFWLVKGDGIYLSWDNSTWVKKAVWETD